MALDPLAAIRRWESGNRNIYQQTGATNSTASGYYQITNQTWRGYAERSGVDLSQYPTAMSAPYDVQTKVASNIFSARGFRDWAPYNSNLRQEIAANGGASAYSLDASPDVSGAGVSTVAASYPGMPPNITSSELNDVLNPNSGQSYPFPNTGANADFPALGSGQVSNNGLDSGSGLSTVAGAADTGATQAAGSGGIGIMDILRQPWLPFGGGLTQPGMPQGMSWWSTAFNIIGNFFARGGIILLGIILLAIGAWAVARGKIQLELPKGVHIGGGR